MIFHTCKKVRKYSNTNHNNSLYSIISNIFMTIEKIVINYFPLRFKGKKIRKKYGKNLLHFFVKKDQFLIAIKR